MKLPEISYQKSKHIIMIFFAACTTLVFYKTAWVSDDAYITFRVVDNFINGHGLRWNIDERVQASTHPLWLAMLSFFVFFTGEFFFTSILISYCTVLFLVYFITKISKDYPDFICVASIFVALILSRSFVDYLSSGLENPLTYLLFASCFYFVFKNDKIINYLPSQLLIISLYSSLVYLTRPDCLVILLPLLIYTFFCYKDKKKGAYLIALGLMPMISWSVFSIVYFGSFVPNTAIAKLGADASSYKLLEQGFSYYKEWVVFDYVGFLFLLLETLFVILYRNVRVRILYLGQLIHLVFILKSGSDFMLGRFMSVHVLLASLVLIMLLNKVSLRVRVILPVFLLLSLYNVKYTFFSPADYYSNTISYSGLADERGFYNPYSGLRQRLKFDAVNVHPWLKLGQHIRKEGDSIYATCYVGMLGWAAGENVHIIDPLALTEPFMARLPAKSDWRIGHFERAFPQGYIDTFYGKTDRFESELLSNLYHDVAIVTRGKLFSVERFKAIVRLHRSYPRELLSQEFHRNQVGFPGVEIESVGPMTCMGKMFALIKL